MPNASQLAAAWVCAVFMTHPQLAEEPPDVALLLPELDDGELPVLNPLELFVELLVPVDADGDGDGLEELFLPELLVVVWCVAPGRTKATAPAAATPATPEAAVSERTLDRPRSLAAAAPAISLRFMAIYSAPVLRALCRLLLGKL